MGDLTVVWAGLVRPSADLRHGGDTELWRVVDTVGDEWTVSRGGLGWRVRNGRGGELLADRPTARRIIAAVQRHAEEGQA